MSQQEFRRRSQQQSSESSADSDYTQHRYRGNRRTSGMPKEEHPSAYGEGIPPYSYVAQEPQRGRQESIAAREHVGSNTRSRGRVTVVRSGPEEDAFETHYRPFQQRGAYREVYKRLFFLRLLLGVLLLLLMAKVIPGFSAVLGVLVTIILLPVAFVIGVIVAVLVLIVLLLSMFKVSPRRSLGWFWKRLWRR